MRERKLRHSMVSVLIFLSLIVNAQQLEDKHKQVDNLLKAWNRSDSPGSVIGVLHDGNFIYKKAFGMANLDLDIALSTESVFRVGSVSKQFMAACMLLLQQQGKLSLEDEIRKYFPQMKDYGAKITIRHLINHTSGIRDYLDLYDISGYTGNEYYYSKQELLDLILRQEELNFVPGEKYMYSNSGYFLSALILEKITGLTLNQFATREIFGPLNMKDTRFNENHNQVVKNRAYAYAQTDSNTFEINMTILDIVGSKGLLTTLDDMAKWDENFYHNKIGGENFTEAMQEVGVLNSGKKIDYALGLRVGTTNGLSSVIHGGWFAGYKAAILRFPTEYFSVICLANLSAINPKALCAEVAEVYLKDKMTIETSDNKPKSTEGENSEYAQSQEIIKKASGIYYSQEIKNWHQLVLKEDTLHWRYPNHPEIKLRVQDEDTLLINQWDEIVLDWEQNQVTGFWLNKGRVRKLYFEKMADTGSSGEVD